MNQILFRYLVLIILFAGGISSYVYSQCNHPDDYTALRALYLSTNGDNWINKTGWPTRAQFLANPTPPSGTDMSGWYGIYCNGRVESLSLMKNKLIGIIPLEIGNLSFLYNLSLGNNIPGQPSLNNILTGELPQTITNLTKLRNLNLSWNKITGSLPNDIDKLSDFFNLSISQNNFSGEIPTSLFNLKNLRILHLSQNNFTGSISKNIKNLVELKELVLGSNKLSGEIPEEIKNCKNIEIIELSSTELEGLIPDIFHFTPKLKILSLGSKNLTGKIPPSLYSLRNLNSFSLFNTKLSDSLSNSIGNLMNLNQLVLWNNNLFSKLPDSLYYLKNLKELRLSGNKFNGPIDNKIRMLKRLKEFELTYNDFAGILPESIGELDSLIRLDLSENNFSGCIPVNFKNFCIIPIVNLSRNPLLPWQGDFAQFCATDGSQQAQIGAPCNNNNPADGENDVIKADCSCGRLDCPDVKLSLNDIVVQLCDTGEKIPLTFTILDTLPSGAIDITWSSPNANTRAAIDTVSNPPLFDTQIAGAGNHLIILTLKQGNCTWTNSMLITSIATPSSDFTVGPGGCVLDPVTVSYTGGTTGAVYTWNFGPDVIGTYSGPGPHSVRWSNPGQKTITLTVFKDGCVSTVTTRTISLSPVLDAPTITCLETKVDGVTFSWGAVQNTNGYNVNVQIVGGAILFQGVVTNTSYDVNNLVEGQDVRITVTAISNNGCPNSSASLICKAKSCPDARLSIPERQITACLTPDIAPIPLTFSIANNIPNETPTISWYSASPKTNTAIKNNTNPPVFVPLEAGEGTHFIELKYEQKGCIWTDSMLIKLNLPAAVLLKNDTVYVKSNVPVVLNVTDNDELPSEPFTIKVKEISTETITVTNFDDQGNITLQVNDEINAEERITYEVCDDCNLCYEGILVIINEDFKNFIPVTLFTPDASSNKTLQFTKLPVKDSKLWIYNRWGQQIYYKEGYENDWNAEGYPGGVYYYYLEIYGVKIKKALTVVK